MTLKSKKNISIFTVLKELITMRIQTLGVGFLPAMLISLARGLLFGLGVSSMQILFDSIEATLNAPEKGLSLIISAVIRMTAIIIGEQILNSADYYMKRSQSLLIRRDLLDRINRKAAKIDPAVYEDTDYLESIEKAKNGSEAGTIITDNFIELFTFFIPFLGYMCFYLYGLRPLLLLTMLILFIPAIVNQMIRSFLLSKLEKISAPIRRQYEHYEDAMCSREYVKETRQLGAFGFFFSRYADLFKSLNAAVWKVEGKSKLFELFMQLFTVSGYGGVLLLLAFSLKDGFITIGAFAAVFASIERLYDTIYGMIDWGFFGRVARNLPFAKNLLYFYRLPERAGKDMDIKVRDIKLINASFQYPGRGEAAISDITLEIKQNETIALVGENGAGKSTLVKLLTGLYLPTSGTSQINGTDMNGISMRSLFSDTSGVFQRYQRYKLSAGDNVRISQTGRKNERDNDYGVNKATVKAGITFESESFPDGVDTMLSREFGGVDLSGGQWQRLAIARGLYRVHGMIILDEPTAAIDPIEETLVYKKFMEYSKNKMTVLVTHRLGSAKIADRILVMDKGKIVEEGSHETLMALNGKYAAMYRAQAKWYEQEVLA